MSAAAVGRRLAVVQPRMRWTIEENLAAMQTAAVRAAGEGAELCIFPELAVTGFHRRIVELAWWGVVEPAIVELRALAAAHRIALSFGAPSFGPRGERFNSQCFVDAAGALVATVPKAGLTPAEATFFLPGSERPVVELAGLRTTAVICREVEDHAQLVPLLRAAAPQLVVWPGLMGPQAGEPDREPPLHVEQAQRLARDTGTWFVQANWPNALNDPRTSAGTGRSACIAPDGRLVFRLPQQAAGVAVFDLGDETFAWHPQPADAG